jgi:hypothetical protein
MSSNSNRGVVYLKAGSVEVQRIDFPTFRNPAGKTIDHGVILKVVTTNICGSDQHMVRGRTTAFGRHGAQTRDHRRSDRGSVESRRQNIGKAGQIRHRQGRRRIDGLRRRRRAAVLIGDHEPGAARSHHTILRLG